MVSFVEDDLNALMSVLPDRDKLLLKVKRLSSSWRMTSELTCPPGQRSASSQGKEVVLLLEDDLNRLIINLSGRDKFLVDVFFSMTAGSSWLNFIKKRSCNKRR